MDKLPKTADGVPVVLGDPVWFPGVPTPLFVGGSECPAANPYMASNNEDGADVSECYSTREAAQAAEKAKENL